MRVLLLLVLLLLLLLLLFDWLFDCVCACVCVLFGFLCVQLLFYPPVLLSVETHLKGYISSSFEAQASRQERRLQRNFTGWLATIAVKSYTVQHTLCVS